MGKIERKSFLLVDAVKERARQFRIDLLWPHIVASCIGERIIYFTLCMTCITPQNTTCQQAMS